MHNNVRFEALCSLADAQRLVHTVGCPYVLGSGEYAFNEGFVDFPKHIHVTELFGEGITIGSTWFKGAMRMWEKKHHVPGDENKITTHNIIIDGSDRRRYAWTMDANGLETLKVGNTAYVTFDTAEAGLKGPHYPQIECARSPTTAADFTVVPKGHGLPFDAAQAFGQYDTFVAKMRQEVADNGVSISVDYRPTPERRAGLLLFQVDVRPAPPR